MADEIMCPYCDSPFEFSTHRRPPLYESSGRIFVFAVAQCKNGHGWQFGCGTDEYSIDAARKHCIGELKAKLRTRCRVSGEREIDAVAPRS